LKITRRKRRGAGLVEFCVTVSVERAAVIEKALHSLLLSHDEGAGVALNERGEETVLAPEPRPGEVLKGFRLRDGFTQRGLAEQLGIAQHHISEMESGKRAISRKMAERLAVFFQESSYKVFI